MKKRLFYACLSVLISMEAQSADFKVVSTAPDYTISFSLKKVKKRWSHPLVTIESPETKHRFSFEAMLDDLREHLKDKPKGTELAIEIRAVRLGGPWYDRYSVTCGKEYYINKDTSDQELKAIDNQTFTFYDQGPESRCTATPGSQTVE